MSESFKYRQVIGSISSRSGSVLLISPESICENPGCFENIEDRCVQEGRLRGGGGMLVWNELGQLVAVSALLKHANCAFPVALEGEHADDIRRLVIDFKNPDRTAVTQSQPLEEGVGRSLAGSSGSAPPGAVGRNLLEGKGYRLVDSMEELVGEDAVLSSGGLEPAIGSVVIEGSTVLLLDPQGILEFEEAEELVGRCEAVADRPMRGGLIRAGQSGAPALVACSSGLQGRFEVRYLRDEARDIVGLVLDLGCSVDDEAPVEPEPECE